MPISFIKERDDKKIELLFKKTLFNIFYHKKDKL